MFRIAASRLPHCSKPLLRCSKPFAALQQAAAAPQHSLRRTAAFFKAHRSIL